MRSTILEDCDNFDVAMYRMEPQSCEYEDKRRGRHEHGHWDIEEGGGR